MIVTLWTGLHAGILAYRQELPVGAKECGNGSPSFQLKQWNRG